MNKIQEAKNNTITIVEDYCLVEENATIIDSWPTIKDDVLLFRGHKDDLAKQIKISQTDFTGNTTNQDNARDAIAKYLFENICTPSCRYARGINDADLLAIFKHSESQMQRYSINSIVPFVETIINKAESLMLTVPAYVTSTDMSAPKILAANALKGTLSGYLGKAKLMQRAVNRSLHQIDAIQKDIFEHDFINLVDDSLHFNIPNPDFSKGMITATNVDDLPTTHDGIQGFGHNELDEVLIGGTITNLDMPDRAPMTFDNLGFYHDDTFRWGTYRYKYSVPGYVDQIITVTIARGEKKVQNVIMVRL